jgi:hypothetical protein
MHHSGSALSGAEVRRRGKPRKLVAAVLAFGLAPLTFPGSSGAHPAARTDSPASRPTLRAKYTSDFTEIYSDKGSKGDDKLEVYRPKKDAGWFQLGDMAMDQYDKDPSYSLLVKADHDDSAYPALIAPDSFTRIWRDTGSAVKEHGSLWHAVAPSPGGHKYTCLGDIAEKGTDTPHPGDTALTNMRCVRSDLLVDGTSHELWNDSGSGAKDNGSVFEVAPKNYTGMNGPTFEARKQHDDPGSYDNYKALDLRQVTFTEQPAVGITKGPLHDVWNANDWKSDQVMSKASLGDDRYTGIPGWVVRTYCRSAGFSSAAGKCTLVGLYEQTRKSDELTVGDKISNQIMNCSLGVTHKELSSSYTTEDQYTTTKGESVSETLEFSIEPFGLGIGIGATAEQSQQWSWESGSSSTTTESQRYGAEPGTVAWVAKVTHHGEIQGIAFVRVNKGIDWRVFSDAQLDLKHHTIKNLKAATQSETAANGGYDPVNGPGGESDVIPIAVDLTGDLPDSGASNASRGAGTALVARPLTDDELKQCAPDNTWTQVLAARNAKYPNLAPRNGGMTTSHVVGHDSGDAVDGNNSTYWESKDTQVNTSSAGGSPSPHTQSFTLDLRTPTRATRLVFKLPPAFSDRSEDVEVLGSNVNDDTKFTSLMKQTVPFRKDMQNTESLILDPNNSTWRYVRLSFTNNSGTSTDDHWRAQLAELEVYAS